MPLRSLATLALACGVLCHQGCKSKGSAPHKSEAIQPSTQPAATPAKDVKLDAAGALRFLDVWVNAQNSGEFARYATLYAENFSGTKRVEGELSQYDRAHWLEDRKTMFDRAATVTVARVQVFEQEGKIELVFQQRWATSTFADVGHKRLMLTRTGESYRIEREEMLSSQLDNKASQGPCAKAFETLNTKAKGIRYFAALGGDSGGMVEVSSHEDANQRSADGFAWEVWETATEFGWRAANSRATSSCGAWSLFTHSCFRPDGSLAEITDRFCTSRSQHGLVCDNITLAYSPDGHLITRKHEAHLVNSGKAPPDEDYWRPAPTPVLHTKQLPFKL
jgi:hypothetical protein